MSKAPNHAELLRRANRLDREEASIKRQKLKLARQMMDAARALGGDQLDEVAPKKKRRMRRGVAKRKYVPPVSRPKARTVTVRAGRAMSETGWTAVMLRILTEMDRPLAYADLKAEVMKTPLATKLAQSDKSFYGGLLKLEQRKQAIRHNGRVATVAAHERFMRDVAAGLVKEEPPTRNPGNGTSPAKAALFEILRRDDKGAPAAELVDELTPILNLETKNSKTSVYNLIARLVKREELIKDGKNVRLPAEVGNLFQHSGAANAVH